MASYGSGLSDPLPLAQIRSIAAQRAALAAATRKASADKLALTRARTVAQRRAATAAAARGAFGVGAGPAPAGKVPNFTAENRKERDMPEPLGTGTEGGSTTQPVDSTGKPVTGATTTSTVKPPKIITTPTTGQTYNPVTPEKLKEMYDKWQSMTPWERDAATRNQAAAIEAARRVRERNERIQEEARARAITNRDNIRAERALKKRQAEEKVAEQRKFNKELSDRQLQRVEAGRVLREKRMDALKQQRIREAQRRTDQRAANAQRNAILATNRRTQQANDAAARKQKLQSIRNSARQGGAFGRQGAQQYFTQQGVNYAPYAGVVNREIMTRSGSLAPGEVAPRSLYGTVGEDVFNRLQEAGRARARSAVAPLTDTGFERRRIADTSINPALNTIRQEHYKEAQDYIDRLLARGVVTQPGYDAALKNLQGQVAAVNTQLQDIGDTVLSGGRQKLTDIGNRANLAASNLGLGQKFNAAPFSTEMADAVRKFQTGLPGALKTQIKGPLFDVTGLANIAGKATGAQNTSFDPYALSNTAKPQNQLFDTSVGMRSVF